MHDCSRGCFGAGGEMIVADFSASEEVLMFGIFSIDCLNSSSAFPLKSPDSNYSK